MLMDASKLGTKEKVDGKNQKTVLSGEEIAKIIDTFNAGEPVEDFCVAVTYEEIKQKKLSSQAEMASMSSSVMPFAQLISRDSSRFSTKYASARRRMACAEDWKP